MHYMCIYCITHNAGLVTSKSNALQLLLPKSNYYLITNKISYFWEIVTSYFTSYY